MIQARLQLDEYTAQVLDVVKGKNGLKNRSEALRKMAQECGSAYVDPKPNESVLKELDYIYEDHKKRHGKRKMGNNELKRLLEI